MNVICIQSRQHWHRLALAYTWISPSILYNVRYNYNHHKDWWVFVPWLSILTFLLLYMLLVLDVHNDRSLMGTSNSRCTSELGFVLYSDLNQNQYACVPRQLIHLDRYTYRERGKSIKIIERNHVQEGLMITCKSPHKAYKENVKNREIGWQNIGRMDLMESTGKI